MNHNNMEKGAMKSMIVGLVALAVLILIGLGGWWYYRGHGTDAMNMGDDATSTVSYVTTYETATTTTYVTQQVGGGAYTPSTPTTFHDSTYGLTISLPSTFTGYRSYVTAGGPANLGGTERIHFVAPGESTDSFVVNVFSKVQWNAIRTQENLAHQNVNDLGEGVYIGENYTWIYSANFYSHAEANASVMNAVFY